MLQLGTLVSPRKGYIGAGLLFKICEITEQYETLPIYKLKAIEINIPLERIDEAKNVENSEWSKSELIVQNKYYVTDSLIEYKEKPAIMNVNNGRGEKEMELLKIYKSRKKVQLEQECEKKSQELREKDEVYLIIKEMENQINVVLENESTENERKVYKYPVSYFYTNITEEKIRTLRIELNKELNKLDDLYEEIEAQLQLTENYDQKIKILKNYDIIDSKYKLKI